MKAFIVDRYRSKDGVRFGDMSNPELRDDDVLIQIHAAGVNPLDSKIRNEEFRFILPHHCRLFWAMRWRGSSSESDPKYGAIGFASSGLAGRPDGKVVQGRDEVDGTTNG
jgi:hypothetical protein